MNRWALMSEIRGSKEPTLDTLFARLSLVDLVLVEGCKRDRHSKIETHRAVPHTSLIANDDPSILAVASDSTHPEFDSPVLRIDATEAVADFVLRSVGLQNPTDASH